jgi:methylated-DNA-[protein]-cysteine S-methyltransferase
MRYTEFPSPLGRLLAVCNGDAVTGLHFETERHPPRRDAGWLRVENDPLLTVLRQQLDEYWAGRRRQFDVPMAPAGTAFQRAVWHAIAVVPYGEVISYGELARRVGSPRGMRAAGLATGHNPISIVVPCHRIVGSTGALTGYGGGLDRKVWLLRHEGVRLPALERAASQLFTAARAE